MKNFNSSRYSYAIVILLFIGCFLSCSKSKEAYLVEFDSFIKEVENTASDMSMEQWIETEKNYEILITEKFNEVKNEFTDEDYKQLGKLKGRFQIIKLQKDTHNLIEETKNNLNEVQGVIEGVLENFDNDTIE